MKNSLLFTYSTNILVRLLTVNMKTELSYPKNPKTCDPILLTLFKMQPHYSQSSRENATSSSGTSPLASYKEVTPLGKCGVREHEEEPPFPSLLQQFLPKTWEVGRSSTEVNRL